ncbi:hypothetical protein WR25_03255 [Diploscapter pachys]|uniref:Uncharacterized protein n=1 Tax=Diploscapter pachys TaxID=2018661 RepID=A0A2A2JQA9_9BILA|nr:hypothetical protein WR25_03255 [Diploscapter pachys]
MAQYVGARAYMLQQRMECKGGKVYDIDSVQCEILQYVTTMIPATGAACYYAQDSFNGGDYNAGWGWGRKRR